MPDLVRFSDLFGSRSGSFFGPKTGTWNPALINNISETKIWTPKMDPDLVPKVGPTIDVFWSAEPSGSKWKLVFSLYRYRDAEGITAY